MWNVMVSIHTEEMVEQGYYPKELASFLGSLEESYSEKKEELVQEAQAKALEAAGHPEPEGDPKRPVYCLNTNFACGYCRVDGTCKASHLYCEYGNKGEEKSCKTCIFSNINGAPVMHLHAQCHDCSRCSKWSPAPESKEVNND
jgi:hypothetical protein